MSHDDMASRWLVFHGGALGDLVLTLQLALMIEDVRRGGCLGVVSRTDLGDPSGYTPNVTRRSLESVGAHWLYCETSGRPTDGLCALVNGRRVLNALGDGNSIVHRQLATLRPRALFSFDPRARDNRGGHIIEQWSADLHAQGLSTRVELDSFRVKLRLEGTRRSAAGSVEGGAETSGTVGRVVISPGSGGREKCWPLECFLRVGRGLRRAGVDTAFMLGPVELERWSDAARAAVAGEFPMIESRSANDLVRILAATDVLLSNDSGPAHLAAMLGTATVTIFGPTRAERWRPLGPHARVIQGDTRAGERDWGVRAETVVAAAAKFT